MDDLSQWTDEDLRDELERRKDTQLDCAPFIQELVNRHRPLVPEGAGTYRCESTNRNPA